MNPKLVVFTLKLLADLEDHIEEVKINDNHSKLIINDCIQCIADYWNSFIVTETANWDNYSDLLNILIQKLLKQENGNSLHPELQTAFNIIKNHQSLVSLQPMLIRSEKVHSAGDSIVRLHQLGLLEPNALAVVTAAKEKQLPFSLNVPLPEQGETLNLYGLVEVIARLDTKFRPAGRWLINHLNVITLKQLIDSIKTSCEQIKSDLIKSDGYHILIVKDKSQEWMANIAMRFLPAAHLPQSVIPFGKDGTVDEQFEGLVDTLEKSKHHHFVLFDDASYSGKQLGELIWKIEMVMQQREMKFTHPTTLTLVIGGMSESALNRIKNLLKYTDFSQKYNIKIEIICNFIFKDIKAMVNDEKVEEPLREKIFQVAANITDNVFTSSSDFLQYFNKTLMVTEWKRPDGYSTIALATKGYTFLNRFNREPKLTLNDNMDPNQNISWEPVRDISAPYRTKK